jgi:hypothetical protein
MAPTRPKHGQMPPDEAEALGIEALAFIAAEEVALRRFLAATGYDPAAIRAEAGSADFLTGVLDYLLGDESLLLVFASHKNIDPSRVAMARRTLAQETGDQE